MMVDKRANNQVGTVLLDTLYIDSLWDNSTQPTSQLSGQYLQM